MHLLKKQSELQMAQRELSQSEETMKKLEDNQTEL